MLLPITSTLAGILALIMLPLTVQVSTRRAMIGMKVGVIHKAVFGDAGDPMLRNSIRAFGNFIEYTPMVLILIALMEMQNAPDKLLWWIGGLFVAGRLVHAFAMTFIPNNPAPAWYCYVYDLRSFTHHSLVVVNSG